VVLSSSYVDNYWPVRGEVVERGKSGSDKGVVALGAVERWDVD